MLLTHQFETKLKSCVICKVIWLSLIKVSGGSVQFFKNAKIKNEKVHQMVDIYIEFIWAFFTLKIYIYFWNSVYRWSPWVVSLRIHAKLGTCQLVKLVN